MPSGLKYKSNQTICAASGKRDEIKRLLLNSFIVTTVCQNHHTYINIILLPSTCLSPQVIKINQKKLSQQLPGAVNSVFTYCTGHLWGLGKKYHLNKNMYILHIHSTAPFSSCCTIYILWGSLQPKEPSVNLKAASCREWMFALWLPSCGHRNLSCSMFTALKQIHLGRGNLLAIPWAARGNLELWLTKRQVVVSLWTDQPNPQPCAPKYWWERMKLSSSQVLHGFSTAEAAADSAFSRAWKQPLVVVINDIVKSSFDD